uniref:WIF domain-containing protein n=1 Tax=Timema poppense TaxID=170557 RepID=A0A7R9CH06_TIMPO|nr:unnamed protein product [Timema poppensis]
MLEESIAERMSAAGAVKKCVLWTLLFVLFLTFVVQCAHKNGDLSLWIDEQQVKMFSGFSMEIYAIVDGHVLPYILDPKFEQYLPIIPSEVAYVNFTWKSGVKKYYYHFDRLQSFDENILESPVISIKTKGRVPRRPKGLYGLTDVVFLVYRAWNVYLFLIGVFSVLRVSVGGDSFLPRDVKIECRGWAPIKTLCALGGN